MPHRVNGIQRVELIDNKPFTRALALFGGNQVVKHTVRTPRGKKVVASLVRRQPGPVILSTDDSDQPTTDIFYPGNHIHYDSLSPADNF